MSRRGDINLAQKLLIVAKDRVASAKRRLRDALKQEAFMRMNRLGINPNVIDGFYSNDSVVVYSAELDMFLSPGSEEAAIIRKLEHDSNALVYFIIAQATYLEPDIVLPMASFLYVSPDVVQLEHDDPIYGPNRVYAYTHNYDWPIASEYGDIYVQRTPSGGVRRLGMHEFEKLYEQSRITQQDD